jgi:phosphohistidine phosphatase
MKQILLLRHAKSSWEDSSLQDFDRPLSSRGINDAPLMGKFMRKSKNKPDQIISSTAQRAKETTNLALNGMKKDESIITWNEDLYYGSRSDYLTAIQSADESTERIMIVGHNPKIEDTAGALIGGSKIANLRIPTAALVCLNTYAIDWKQVSWGSCQLAWMMIPKVLKQL